MAVDGVALAYAIVGDNGFFFFFFNKKEKKKGEILVAN